MTKGNGLPCKKCGTSEWHNNGNCKQCTYEQGAKRQKDNPEAANEKSRRWRAENPEKSQRSTRNWKAKNPEKTREHDKVGGRRWRKNNPGKVNAATRRHRTRKAKTGGSHTAAEFQALCNQYDNRCACCGKKKKLEFDHVIPVSKGGTSDISNGQPLCRGCNASKGDKTTDYRTKPGILHWIQNKLFD